MAGPVTTQKLRDRGSARTLLPARRRPTKQVCVSEICLTMKLVSPHPRRTVRSDTRPLVARELMAVNDGDDDMTGTGRTLDSSNDNQAKRCSNTHQAKRKRTRRLGSPARSVRAKDARAVCTRQVESILPARTWCKIQDMIANAKSLGDITCVTLEFFNEHELLRSGKSGEWSPALPIVIPASEVYNMLVPRKRRIYDVLHVLEGFGIIKRVRYADTTGSKGGSFLYFGKHAAIQHLARIQQNAIQAVESVRRQTVFEAQRLEDEDTAVLRMCEEQAEIERWPSLTATTAAFLSLLFLHDKEQAMALPSVSSRLVDAKRSRNASLAHESAFADVNRRVYDVVSVLASCEIILISVTPGVGGNDERDDSPDRISSRKHVRFNYAIFDDARCLKVGDVHGVAPSSSDTSDTATLRKAAPSTPQTYMSSQALHIVTPEHASIESNLAVYNSGDDISNAANGCAVKNEPVVIESDDWDHALDAVSMLTEWDDSPLRIDLASIRVPVTDAEDDNDTASSHHNVVTPSPPQSPLPSQSRLPLLSQSRRSQPTSSICYHEVQTESFDAIVEPVHHGTREWWDDSLQSLTLKDALPLDDMLEWESALLMQAIDHAYDDNTWGQQTPVAPCTLPSSPPPVEQEQLSSSINISISSISSSIDDDNVDLTCYETFPADDDPTDGYFAFSWSHLAPLASRE